jgi:hypothetical protein
MELQRSAEVNDNVLMISTGHMKAQAQWMMPATNGMDQTPGVKVMPRKHPVRLCLC